MSNNSSSAATKEFASKTLDATNPLSILNVVDSYYIDRKRLIATTRKPFTLMQPAKKENMDRLLESAKAIDGEMINDLFQCQLMEFHLNCTRWSLAPEIDWSFPPAHPSERPHLYHNSFKVIAAIIRCKGWIQSCLKDNMSNEQERAMILRHPVWARIKKRFNVDPPEI